MLGLPGNVSLPGKSCDWARSSHWRPPSVSACPRPRAASHGEPAWAVREGVQVRAPPARRDPVLYRPTPRVECGITNSSNNADHGHPSRTQRVDAWREPIAWAALRARRQRSQERSESGHRSRRLSQGGAHDWCCFTWSNAVQQTHHPGRRGHWGGLYAKLGIVVFPSAGDRGRLVGGPVESGPARVAPLQAGPGLAAWAPSSSINSSANLRSEASPLSDPFRVPLLVGRTADFSFPSDHLAVAAAVRRPFLVDRRLGLSGRNPGPVHGGRPRLTSDPHYPG